MYTVKIVLNGIGALKMWTIFEIENFIDVFRFRCNWFSNDAMFF